MKRLMYRRRPQFESLESMVLLSGTAVAVHPAAAAMVAMEPASTIPASISGTVKGTYHAGKAAGSPVTFTSSGMVSPLGHVTLKGSLQLSTTSGNLILSTKHGKVQAGAVVKTFPTIFTYTITGGTGRFAGATGSGLVSTNVDAFAGSGQSHGHFAITFQAVTS